MYDWAQEVQLFLFAKADDYKKILKRNSKLLAEMTMQLYGRLTNMVQVELHGNRFNTNGDKCIEVLDHSRPLLPRPQPGVDHWHQVCMRVPDNSKTYQCYG